jgi:hypothetical protein
MKGFSRNVLSSFPWTNHVDVYIHVEDDIFLHPQYKFTQIYIYETTKIDKLVHTLYRYLWSLLHLIP